MTAVVSDYWQGERAKGVEFIDRRGHLQVPLAKSFDRAPEREGWEAFWVTINASATPQKWVHYRKVTA